MISESPAATEALGAELAERLRPGDIVLIEGDLGTGKTTYVRGACRALGVHEPVTSPTYTLVRRYTGDGVEISHLDLHRLGPLAAEDPGLLEDEAGPGRITFVEWPPGELDLPGSVAAHVRLEHAGDGRRRVEVT